MLSLSIDGPKNELRGVMLVKMKEDQLLGCRQEHCVREKFEMCRSQQSTRDVRERSSPGFERLTAGRRSTGVSDPGTEQWSKRT